MSERRQGGQGGFSLIELLVAMAITLIVSGAIYGLLAGGQNAFRREPELTERQQNIRLAMDMIMRDVANAGAGLPPFIQLFTTGLDDELSSPVGPSGARSDGLEMLTSTGDEGEPVCAAQGNGAGTEVFLTRASVPPLGVGRQVFLIFSTDRDTGAEDTWTARRVTAQDVAPYPAGTTGVTPPNCTQDTQHARLAFDTSDSRNASPLCALAPIEPRGNVASANCANLTITRIAFANQVRYQIRNDPGDGVPVLQRSDASGTQTLARGIEELQVQYTQVGSPTAWVDDAPSVAAPADPVVDASYATLINHVRVTLTSRSEAQNIQGVSTGAGGTPTRLRGSLTSTGSPRSVLMHVARGRPSPVPSPGYWYWE